MKHTKAPEKRFADKARAIIKKWRPAEIERYDVLMDQVSKGYEPTTSERLFLDSFRADLLRLGAKLSLEALA